LGDAPEENPLNAGGDFVMQREAVITIRKTGMSGDVTRFTILTTELASWALATVVTFKRSEGRLEI
jgi:hypothetical protein